MLELEKPTKPTTPFIDCQKVLLRRCANALLIYIGAQFILLCIFLFVVNFNLLHLIDLIIKTLAQLCSPFTWLSMLPLLVVVTIYGVIFAKLLVKEQKYYPTRYRWFISSILSKFLFLSAHVLVGFVTAWFYTRYLRHFSNECKDQKCINSCYIFLLSVGIYMSVYYFFKKHMRHNPRIDFPLAQQLLGVKLRMLLINTVFRSLPKSTVPIIIYIGAYGFIGTSLHFLNIKLWGLGSEVYLLNFLDFINNSKLICFAWILSAQILSNMNLMQQFYSAYLTDNLPLVLSKLDATFSESGVVSLADAIGVSNLYIMQCLAANHLYKIAKKKCIDERRELYTLSQPGNHAVNWRQVATQSLNVIQAFCSELENPMQKENSIIEDKKTTAATVAANIAAEKLMLRQYNAMHGIRPINTHSTDEYLYHADSIVMHVPTVNDRLTKLRDEAIKSIEQSLQKLLLKIPFISYLFTEPEDNRLVYIYYHAQPIVWLTQGLAHICAKSVKEDVYGVVQEKLSEIIQSLLKLSSILEEHNFSNHKNERLKHNYASLRAAVRRGLHIIYMKFGDNLKEILNEEDRAQYDLVLNMEDS